MGTATVRLQLEGEPGAISVRTFVAAVRDTFDLLANIDVALSRDPERTLDWLVTKLSTGSLVLEARSRARPNRDDIGREVAQAFVSGMRRVETEGGSPPYLSETGMRTARRLLNLIGRDGATGMVVSDLTETAILTRTAAENIAELIPERQHSLGAIEGRLETISIHKRPKLTVYLSRTHKAVSCRVPDGELFQTAMRSLGRRVLVAGIVHANARGEPIRVEVKHIRVFRDTDQLPRSSDLYATDPHFTGALSTEDFLRSIRGA